MINHNGSTRLDSPQARPSCSSPSPVLLRLPSVADVSTSPAATVTSVPSGISRRFESRHKTNSPDSSELQPTPPLLETDPVEASVALELSIFELADQWSRTSIGRWIIWSSLAIAALSLAAYIQKHSASIPATNQLNTIPTADWNSARTPPIRDSLDAEQVSQQAAQAWIRSIRFIPDNDPTYLTEREVESQGAVSLSMRLDELLDRADLEPTPATFDSFTPPSESHTSSDANHFRHEASGTSNEQATRSRIR